MSGDTLNWFEQFPTSDLLFDNSEDDSDFRFALGYLTDAPGIVPTVIAETVFFGFSSMLFLAAFCIVLRSSKKDGFNSRKLVIPICGCLMFIISILHWTLQVFYLENGPLRAIACSKHSYTMTSNLSCLEPKTSTGLLNSSGYIAQILLSLNVILGDIVVLWRVYAAWNQRRWVLIACGLSSISTIVVTVTAISNVGYPALDVDDSSISIVIQSSSLLSNVLATALIAIKSWCHRRDISVLLHTTTRRTMVESVLSLLFESGIVYSCLWFCVRFQPTSSASHRRKLTLIPFSSCTF